MSDNVLVLGGHGLLGKHLALLAPTWRFAGREINPLVESTWNQIIAGDTVVDLVPPALPREELGQAQSHYVSHKLRFMDWCSSRGVKRYVFLSSGGSIYGTLESRTPFVETAPLHPISQYGAIKKLEEEKLLSLPGMSSISLRAGNVYPRLQCRDGRGGFIVAAVRALTQNRPLTLFGDLSTTKHFISADDVARAIVLSVKSELTGAVNIAGSSAHTLGEVAHLVESQFNKTLVFEHKPSLPNDVLWFVLNTDRARSELGFEPQIDLTSGIKALIKEWKLA